MPGVPSAFVYSTGSRMEILFAPLLIDTFSSAQSPKSLSWVAFGYWL